MASRDLTAAFVERRTAAKIRRRTGDGMVGSRMKPFGKISCYRHFDLLKFMYLTYCLYFNGFVGISKGGMDSDSIMEVGFLVKSWSLYFSFFYMKQFI